MNIDSIDSGIVLDHITAKRGMEIYRYLRLDEKDCTVAMIRNVKSGKMGRKDIIKIDETIDIDLDALGYIDPGVTVNIIRDGVLVEKKRLELPERLEDVIRCANPRCITSTEPGIKHVFNLSDGETREYRCAYCESSR
jgi:aspartate carbamoyltransferase regulatory subunit